MPYVAPNHHGRNEKPNPTKDKQDVQSNERSTIRMKLCYDVKGKDAGHIKTKDSPQNRGRSVNNAGFFALQHKTNGSFPIKRVILIIDRNLKLVEYFR